MKRILLTFALACLLAGHANADILEIDYDTALTFRQIFAINGRLEGVFDCTTTPPTRVYKSPIGDDDAYADDPQGLVGFVGTLTGDDSWIRIGLKNGDFGTYTGLRAFIANDGQDNQSGLKWKVRLFANNEVDAWTELQSRTSSDEFLPFDEMALTTFGFDVLLDAGSDPCVKWGPTDRFYMSVVAAPVPAAALLAMLGLGMAGMKLRRFV